MARSQTAWAFDGAVPRPVIDALKADIVRAQARRRRAGDGGTHWYALDAPPRLLFEQTIQHLRTLVPHGGAFVGAEWWLRATPPDTGFPFHFDRDEGIRRRVVSPDLASILYLSGAGGPTVIIDATPSRTAAPTAGVAVQPRPGRFAMFPGTHLHGVLPVRPGRWPRVTMLINWWRSEPRMERAPRERGSRPASRRWRIGLDPARTPLAAVGAIDPGALMARAAWRELIAKQATYR